MGRLKGNTTARRGKNGEVEYDIDYPKFSDPTNPNGGNPRVEAIFRRVYNGSPEVKRAKEKALGELLRSEEAAVRNTTSELSGAGNVSGQPTGGSVATTTTQTQAPEGNPGMGDTGANADIDLSTSDTTTRRKAGYRRDSGIRI